MAEEFIVVAQAVEPTIQVVFLPIDVVALIGAVLGGTATLMGAFATTYALVSSIRSKHTMKVVEEVKTDIGVIKTNVVKLEVATNSLVAKAEAAARAAGHKEGAAEGVATAATLKKGREEGRSERPELPHRDEEVPVKDDRVAEAGEKAAAALEESADANKRLVALAEKDHKGDKP